MDGRRRFGDGDRARAQTRGAVRRTVAAVLAGLAGVALAVAPLVATPGTAIAQRLGHAPSDVGGDWSPKRSTEETRVVLPTPPDDYRTERHGFVEWTYPAQASEEVRELIDVLEPAWARLGEELG